MIKSIFLTHPGKSTAILPWTEQYIAEYQSIPQQGFYKNNTKAVCFWRTLPGTILLNAQAYVGLPISKSVAMELGHGRHFIGNGNAILVVV